MLLKQHIKYVPHFASSSLLEFRRIHMPTVDARTRRHTYTLAMDVQRLTRWTDTAFHTFLSTTGIRMCNFAASVSTGICTWLIDLTHWTRNT